MRAKYAVIFVLDEFKSRQTDEINCQKRNILVEYLSTSRDSEVLIWTIWTLNKCGYLMQEKVVLHSGANLKTRKINGNSVLPS